MPQAPRARLRVAPMGQAVRHARRRRPRCLWTLRPATRTAAVRSALRRQQPRPAACLSGARRAALPEAQRTSQHSRPARGTRTMTPLDALRRKRALSQTAPAATILEALSNLRHSQAALWLTPTVLATALWKAPRLKLRYRR